MRKELQKGASNLLGIIILFVILAIMVSSGGSSGPKREGDSFLSFTPGVYGVSGESSGSGSGSYLSSYDESGEGEQTKSSNYSNSVSIGSGNASYAYQSYEEYITIENRSRNSIDITGWQLRNGKDHRAYNYGGNLQRFSADIVSIPQGTLRLSPTSNNIFQNIVLGSGERAIVTTGSIAVQSPYKIVSFKENICSGYIEGLDDYAFTPPLTQNCPRPYDEPGLNSLDIQCKEFIKRLSSCRQPKFDPKTPDGKGTCTTCVNGKILTSQCAGFIKEHFTYQGCVAVHGSKPNFSLKTWRIFLGRGWEMWSKDYETIELYDRSGQLVDFQNY